MPDQKFEAQTRQVADGTSVAVRVLLTSGGQRIVETADGAHTSGEFFMITRRSASGGATETLLTLRAQDVVGAEIVRGGTVTRYVAGKGTSVR